MPRQTLVALLCAVSGLARADLVTIGPAELTLPEGWSTVPTATHSGGDAEQGQVVALRREAEGVRGAYLIAIHTVQPIATDPVNQRIWATTYTSAGRATLVERDAIEVGDITLPWLELRRKLDDGPVSGLVFALPDGDGTALLEFGFPHGDDMPAADRQTVMAAMQGVKGLKPWARMDAAWVYRKLPPAGRWAALGGIVGVTLLGVGLGVWGTWRGRRNREKNET